MIKHEDERRVLIEWIDNQPIKSCKILITKGYTVVGDHYHNKKDEWFYLLSGYGEYKLGEDGYKPMIGVVYAPRGTRHTFKLSNGAVMLSAASEPFDINDEIK